ncbi:unnamed protein product, partial [Laminaria digitata]
ANWYGGILLCVTQKYMPISYTVLYLVPGMHMILYVTTGYSISTGPRYALHSIRWKAHYTRNTRLIMQFLTLTSTPTTQQLLHVTTGYSISTGPRYALHNIRWKAHYTRNTRLIMQFLTLTS